MGGMKWSRPFLSHRRRNVFNQVAFAELRPLTPDPLVDPYGRRVVAGGSQSH